MKFAWLMVIVFVISLGYARTAEGQVSIYAEGGADYLNGGPYANFLYGGIAGVIVDGSSFLKSRLFVSGDMQATAAYNTAGGSPSALAPNELYTSLTVGPRLTWGTHFLRLYPYIQVNVGFGRYQDPTVHSSTDSVLGGQAGVTRRLTSRFDAVFDYSYNRFGYNLNKYNPQMFSAGAVFHFVKR